MAFNKISPISTPSFHEIVSQVHDLQRQRMANEQMKMANAEASQTQAQKIAALNSGYGLNNMQNQSGQQLLPAQTQFAEAQLRSQGQLLPHQTRQGIAQANSDAAKANMQASNPLIGMSGNTGTLGVIEYLRNQKQQNGVQPMAQGVQPQDQPGAQQNTRGQPQIGSGLGFDLKTPQGQADFLESTMFAQQKKDMALGNYYNTRNQFLDFKSLPTNTQNEMISQARAYGMAPDQALSFFKNGGTLEQAREVGRTSGIDVDSAMPVYSPTSSNVTQTKKGAAGVAEVAAIDKHLTDALAPFSRTWNGYSLKQVAKAIKGDDIDGQAKYLAARALTPELSAARINAVGGNVGIEAIREVGEKTYGELKTLRPYITEEVFRKAQKYTDEWIKEGMEARSKSIYNVSENAGIGKKVMDKGKAPDLTGDFMGVLG